MGAFQDAIPLLIWAIECATIDGDDDGRGKRKGKGKAKKRNSGTLTPDRPSNILVGLMHARLAMVYCELTFSFDLAIPAAVAALRLLGAPPPEHVSGGMVAFEATLLHTGMSSMTRGYSHLSRLRKKNGNVEGGKKKREGMLLARSIVHCWSVLTWSVTGATLNTLVVGSLKKTLGWPLELAKPYCIIHTANLAAAVRDSPEYPFALSAVGVVGFMGMHSMCSLAMDRASAALEELEKRFEPTCGQHRDEREREEEVEEEKRVFQRALAIFHQTAGALCMCGIWGDQAKGVELLRRCQGEFRSIGNSVHEMIVTNFLISVSARVGDDLDRVKYYNELRSMSEAATGYASYAGKIWTILHRSAVLNVGGAWDDVPLAAPSLRKLTAEEGIPMPAYAMMTALSIDILWLAYDGLARNKTTEDSFVGAHSEAILKELAKNIKELVQLIVTQGVDDFLPWTLLWACTFIIAHGMLIAYGMVWPSSSSTPPGCSRDELLPAMRLVEKVVEKGARAQPLCALSCRLLHVLLGEAIDPVKFGAPGTGEGVARVRALERELERASSETSFSEHDVAVREVQYHLERLTGDSSFKSKPFHPEDEHLVLNLRLYRHNGSLPWMNIPCCPGPVARRKSSGGGIGSGGSGSVWFRCFSSVAVTKEAKIS